MSEYDVCQMLQVNATRLSDPATLNAMVDALLEAGRRDEAEALRSGEPYAIDEDGYVRHGVADLARYGRLYDDQYEDHLVGSYDEGGELYVVYAESTILNVRGLNGSQSFHVHRWVTGPTIGPWTPRCDWSFDEHGTVNDAVDFLDAKGGTLDTSPEY